MLNHSPLLNANSNLEVKDGVQQNTEELFHESYLSEKSQSQLAKLIESSPTRALGSLRVNASINSDTNPEYQSLCEADASAYQFLYPLNLDAIHSVLDLSEDLGGVAHFLADQVNVVDSVKIDPGLAKLAALRCASKPNVTVFSDKLNSFIFPEKSYDLIIIGQLEKLNVELDSFDAFMTALRAALSPQGVLLLNAPNKGSLAKLLNSGSGQAKPPYHSAYTSSANSSTVNELSRRRLRNVLLAQSFDTVDFHSSYSQQSAVNNLFSEDYLTSNVNALNHFYQLNYLDDKNRSEYLLFKRLIEEKTDLVDLASRFIVVAGADRAKSRLFYNNDFSYLSNYGLLDAYQTVTCRVRSGQEVSRSALFPEQQAPANLVKQQLESVAFQKGTLLAGEWLTSLLAKDRQRLTEHFNEFQVWVNELNDTEELHGLAFNSLASSIIVDARSGRYHLINKQWQLNKGNSYAKDSRFLSDFISIRALFWFAVENAPLFESFAIDNEIYSIGNFIVRYAKNVHSLDELTRFIELEQAFLDATAANIAVDFVEANVNRLISTGQNKVHSATHDAEQDQKSPQLDAQLDNQSLHHELQRQNRHIVEYQSKLESRDQRIEDLMVHRDDLLEMVKNAQGQVAIERNTQGNLYAQIEHLEARIHIKQVRYDELKTFLFMRPTTRLKRFLRRWTTDLLKDTTPVVEPIVNVNAYEDDEAPIPFAELPEGKLIGMNTENYDQWITENTPTESDIALAKAEIEKMPYKPVFSILVPIYNTDPEYLLPMIESVRNQIYPHWQLCLVDDCSPKTYLKRILEQQAIDDDRICIKLNDVNQGISVTTNDALSIATGDYIALLDHDDEITIDALYENAKLINKSPDVGLIYSDEDKMELDGSRIEPYFKPDYSPDLLDTNNYICHFTVVKRSIMEEIGGFREGLDGSQDHDVILRAARAASEVAHIPKVLYHWRKIPGSTAVEYDSKGYAWEAGRKAIEDLHRKFEDNVRVEFGTLKGSYRLIREIVGEPLVSIIIPFKDKPELLDACINSILQRSSYQNFEIVGVSNNSEQALTHERMAHFESLDPRVRFIEHNVPFNFSEVCNHGVSKAQGEYVVLLNNDIEILSPDWIECMLEHAQREQIGAVGCKLLFPDGRIQHAGVVAGMVGAAGHTHKFFPEQHIGYNGRLHMTGNVSAVTGAMMMVSKQKFEAVNGLDAENLAVAYNDIDFCLKLINKGYFNVFTPHARAIHHESVSRGYEDTEEKMQRLLKEQQHFLTTWKDFLEKGDPFYNPNMSLKNERFSFKFKD